MLRTVFLDRDGVINFDSASYILSWDEFKFIPGSIEAIARLTSAGFRIFIITNQSAVGRGLITTDVLFNIFSNMTRAIESGGGQIDGIFFCPHTPKDGCDCRKPLPGMILNATKKYGINLDLACMVGDKPSDIKCARAAGCGYAILLGNNTISDASHDPDLVPDIVLPDLKAAANRIISRLGKDLPRAKEPAL
ncbi:MAG: D-glycero-beta-D-manno-heptose 1,7-bisphosphate 7-phosphatase [Deltaproteobacteria bacterium]|nr:D-glycero-beta-D-manno-heptose 1,7-bisphosphate 7-phosphatase [Deltaproteobacteria bacterium]